ncbi:MAG: aminoacyl-tRNA deacylase [Sulfurifustis sp.]
MSAARTVEAFLLEHAVRYTVLEHPRSLSSKETSSVTHLPPDEIAKAVILGDEKGYLMAVIPADHHVEMRTLCEKLGRRLDLVAESRLPPIFKDCELGAIPPIGPAYNIETIVDASLVGRKKIWFVAGDHYRLLGVDGKDFVRMLASAQFSQFSH